MKLQFDPNLDYQKEAVAAIVDVFKGQEKCRTNFTVAPLKHQPQLRFESMTPAPSETPVGVGNRLFLLDEDLRENIRRIQLRNGLRPSEIPDGEKFNNFFKVAGKLNFRRPAGRDGTL